METTEVRRRMGCRDGGRGRSNNDKKRGCVVMSTDSILETHHFTFLHRDGKCAACIIKHEVNLCNYPTGAVLFMDLSKCKC